MAVPQQETPQMHVVTFKNTGHVLGVMTRRADMDGALDPAIAVPNGVEMTGPFYGDSTSAVTLIPRLLVSLDQLDIVASKISRPLLLQPARGVASGSDAQPLPAQTRAATLALTANTVQVTTNLPQANPAPNPQPVTADTNFWVLIEEANPADPANPGRRVTRGVIPATQSNSIATTITLTALALDAPPGTPTPPAAPLTAGTWFAVIFLPGHAPEVAQYVV